MSKKLGQKILYGIIMSSMITSVAYGATAPNKAGTATDANDASQVAIGGNNSAYVEKGSTTEGLSKDYTKATIGNLEYAYAGGDTHFYSVNSTNTNTNVGNYDNKGATGGNALAAGVAASASGNAGTAVGVNASASGTAGTAVGSTATASGYSATAVGSQATANGYGATSVGRKSTASGSDSSAFGSGAIASGGNSTALGTGANAGGAGSVALGLNSSAAAGQGIAIGRNAVASHDSSVALGSYSTTAAAVGTTSAKVGNITYGGFAGTDPKSTVSVGTTGAERTVTNVAAGRISSTSTDAINGSQLYATNNVINNVATSLRDVSNTVNNLSGEIKDVGALGAALSALKPIQYDPLEPTQIMAGYGNYRGSSALALGVAHYKNESTMFHAGVSFAGGNSHVMANAGVTWKIGNRDAEAAVADRYRRGPISASYGLQDEVSSLKSENAGLKETVTNQQAQINQILTELQTLKNQVNG